MPCGQPLGPGRWTLRLIAEDLGVITPEVGGVARSLCPARHEDPSSSPSERQRRQRLSPANYGVIAGGFIRQPTPTPPAELVADLSEDGVTSASLIGSTSTRGWQLLELAAGLFREWPLVPSRICSPR